MSTAAHVCAISGGSCLHQCLIPKRLFEKGDMFLTVLPWVEVGATPETIIPLFKESEDGVEEHLVICLPGCIQEFPGRYVVMATNAADESECTQNLLLGQQYLHNLIVGRRQTLQHVQGQLVCRWVSALQRQEQAGQRFGITENMILEELVQHVEEVVLDQSLDDQLIEVVLNSDLELVE